MLSISGPWKSGYAFDIYNLKIEHIGEDQYGHPHFNTKRSAMGQCLYDLKYGQNFSELEKIIRLLSSDSEFREFIKKIDIILTTPPSNKNRRLQPVVLTAQGIARIFQKELQTDVFRSSNFEEIKNIDSNEKYERMKKSLTMKGRLEKSKNILIFDDVFDSGATISAMTNIMIENGYLNIFAFTLTKMQVLV
jgi:predicted amidophosphoribosyltransferase